MKWEGLVLMSRFIDGFKLKANSGFLFFFFLLWALFIINPCVFSCSLSESQAAIQSVSVELDGKPAEPEITELVTISAGKMISFYKITQVVKQLYKTGLFSDIQVKREGREGAKLTFVLTSQPYVRSIIFKGSEKISPSKLKQELSVIKEGEIFYEGKLFKAAEELKKILRKRGKFNPNIEAYSGTTDEPTLVDVFFEIKKIEEYEVEDIVFQGDVIFPDVTIKKEMNTQVGDLYRNFLLVQDTESIKDLYGSEGYQRVEIKIGENFNEEENLVELVLSIKAHEKIEILIEGADVPLSLVKPIWETGIFMEWGVERGKAKIIKYMRKKGYLFANVRGSIIREDNKIQIIYQVFPGEKHQINNIIFERVKYFSPDELKSQLAIRENTPLLSNISGDELFELPSEIESLYETQGFPNTRIAWNFKKYEKKVDAVFFIEEGVQNVTQKVSFRGANSVPEEQLNETIETFEGGPFYQPRIQRDVENLENFYLNLGYRGTKIRSDIKKTGDNSFNVEFNINEGQRVRIRNVIIAGNNITQRNTIIREVLLQSGDYARYDEIRKTKRRLENLGIFTKVIIEEISLNPGWENLVINVREGERNYVSLGVGLETKNEPRFFQAWNSIVRPRGTAELIRGNIFGTGAQLSVVGQISIKEKRGVISWEQPYLFGIPIDTFLNAWLERESRKSYSFDRRGITLSGIRPIAEDEDKIFMVTLRFARTSLFELKVSESEVDRQFFPFSATSISGSIIWDKRSDSFNPETGYFASAVLEWAYPLFHAESDYQKLFTKYQQFFQLMPGVTFSLTSRLGLGRGRMPIHERFFAGGSNSFRGTAFDELGPKDPGSLEPIGGKALFLVNFELSFPLISYLKDLRGAVFYDKGNVFYKRSQFDLTELQDAIGLGLRYTTPLGPVRFELGWNLDAPPDKKQPLVIIAIGHVF